MNHKHFNFKIALVLVITLGLTAGNVLAVEVSEEDNKKLQAVKQKETEKALPAHEQPAPAHPSGSKAGNLAEAATNPISNLMQFQVQNAYKWANYNSDGYANVSTIQTVIPVALPWKSVPMMITRTTLPYVTTPNLGEPIDRRRGFGDTDFLALLTPKLKTKGVQLGVGFNSVFPTAGDNQYTGNGKYQLGPSVLFISMRVPSWQFGIFAYQLWDIASSKSGGDRPGVSKLSLQPVIVKHFAKGWYIGSSDTPNTYDFKANKWTLAIGAQAGRVQKFGKLPVKWFGEILHNPVSNNGAAMKWELKLNLTFLFPE